MSWRLHKVGRMRLAAITLLVALGSLSSAAAQPQQRPSALVDVALSAEGHLISHCEDEHGRPVGDAIVELVRDREMLTWTTSRPDGSFILRNVKPGTYRIQCGECDRAIRVWSETAAPPAARVPIVIVVAAAASPNLPDNDTISSVTDDDDEATADAADTADAAGDPEPVLALQLLDGTQRKAGAALEPAVADVAPSVAEQDVVPPELSSQHTHAHHTIETTEIDAPFDPFAGTPSEHSETNDPEFADLADEPLAAPVQAQHPPTDPSATGPVPADPTPAAVARPVPQEVPLSGGVRYIPRSVGPTVGDVVVTSIGIAGITMGIVAIHKYDNRRIRRVVSP